MSKDKNKDEDQAPHGHRDRGLRDENPQKDDGDKHDSHDPEAARYEAEKTFKPDRDGSEL